MGVFRNCCDRNSTRPGGAFAEVPRLPLQHPRQSLSPRQKLDCKSLQARLVVNGRAPNISGRNDRQDVGRYTKHTCCPIRGKIMGKIRKNLADADTSVREQTSTERRAIKMRFKQKVLLQFMPFSYDDGYCQRRLAASS